jgi:Glucose/sorbosone dehydrogenases
LRGGLGSNLVDKIWKHGASDAEIMANIKQGIAKVGMPAWGKSLSDEEIRGLVIYLHEQEAEAAAADFQTKIDPTNGVFSTDLHKFKLEEVAKGTGTLWSMDFMPDGSILATQKDGKLWRFKDGKRYGPIMATPKVKDDSQGGLLEVQLHPDYAKNGWVYLSYAVDGANGGSMTQVVRGKIKADHWLDQETIFAVPDKYLLKAGYHFGSRFAFQGGYLFFSIGDRGSKEMAQDLTRPNGKIHRIHDDGRIPNDNPFVTTKGAYPSIWSYGHRNPQGLDFDPITGQLWATEHGPRGGDETNIIEPGKNYGWPVITYGMNYDGTPITAETAREGMEQPKHYWVPSIAVCGIDFYTGDKFSKWTNNLIVGSLAKQELHRLVIVDSKVVKDEILMKNQGRIRDVANGPDGYIYVILNPDSGSRQGAIYRLINL